jgi:hypothetical protein
MYPGKSKIIYRSTFGEDLRTAFLLGFNKQPNYFDVNNPRNGTDLAVLELIHEQGYVSDRPYIEYWFQEQTAGQQLWPHVDFNDKLRHRLAQGESIPPERLMSPITIACYLETKNLYGGEFCISSRSWLDYEREIHPAEALKEEMLKYDYECYNPNRNDLLYFEGSRWYHWINPVVLGSRKSMLINFWDEI